MTSCYSAPDALTLPNLYTDVQLTLIISTLSKCLGERLLFTYTTASIAPSIMFSVWFYMYNECCVDGQEKLWWDMRLDGRLSIDIGTICSTPIWWNAADLTIEHMNCDISDSNDAVYLQNDSFFCHSGWLCSTAEFPRVSSWDVHRSLHHIAGG